jgi:hypothetical protein
MEPAKTPKPLPLLVQVLALPGFVDVLQEIPFKITGDPPIAVTLPPPVAVFGVIDAVSNVGGAGGMHWIWEAPNSIAPMSGARPVGLARLK